MFTIDIEFQIQWSFICPLSLGGETPILVSVVVRVHELYVTWKNKVDVLSITKVTVYNKGLSTDISWASKALEQSQW